MKKCFLLLLMVFLVETTFAQGLILGLGKHLPDFLRPQGDPAATESITYSFFPTVNQSSLRINWIGVTSHPYVMSRDEEGNIYGEDLNRELGVKYDFYLEIDYFPITWMFPNSLVKTFSNSFKSTWGCLGASLVSAQLKFGRKRTKFFVETELIGVSTLNESLGDKIDVKGGAKNIYNSASAGIDYGLGRHSYLRISGGLMLRGFNTLYPFVGISLLNEETFKADKYRTKYGTNIY